jgi:hypothetical protein
MIKRWPPCVRDRHAARSRSTAGVLALVHYQPYSVEGLKLSRILLAEFTQSVPRRTLVVQRTTGNGLRVTTTGPAAGNDLGDTSLPAIAVSQYVTATVPQRDPSSDNELDWQLPKIQLDLTCHTACSACSWTGGTPTHDVESGQRLAYADTIPLTPPRTPNHRLRSPSHCITDHLTSKR